MQSVTSGHGPIVLSEVGEGIAQITLNRPHKRNALDSEARSLLLEALVACRHRHKVIMLTGAGPVFCAGMDLNQLTTDDMSDEDELNDSWRRVQETIARHPAIVIASARGYALGGGSTLLNVADLAVVAEDVQIGMPEIGFGYYPGIAGPAAQLRLSAKRAAWMVLTAKRIDGRTAQAWGMVNQAVPADQLADATLALARHVAQFDAVALEWSKKALRQIPTHITDLMTALEFGSYTNAEIHARSLAHKSSVKSFVYGRPNPGQGAGAL